MWFINGLCTVISRPNKRMGWKHFSEVAWKTLNVLHSSLWSPSDLKLEWNIACAAWLNFLTINQSIVSLHHLRAQKYDPILENWNNKEYLMNAVVYIMANSWRIYSTESYNVTSVRVWEALTTSLKPYIRFISAYCCKTGKAPVICTDWHQNEEV